MDVPHHQEEKQDAEQEEKSNEETTMMMMKMTPCKTHGDDDDDTICFNKDDERITISNGTHSHKPSIQDEMLASVNNLRLNVNNHIIGKMRKISITELNRRSRSSRHAKYYRFAFYLAITSLSFLFLYLIYQNLFND